MDALIFLVAGFVAVIVLGALAATFGADSRDSNDAGALWDPQRRAAGGLR